MKQSALLLLLVCMPWTQPRAGIVEGEQAFRIGDYERAYEELSPIGLSNVLAAYYLGLLNLDVRWSRANPAMGIRWLTLSAQRGQAAAQTRLALAYEYGDVVAQDYRAAARWMLEAARGGNADAQYYLGQYYRNGRGVVQDDAQAFAWIHRSVEYHIAHERLLDALLYLGAACEWGRGLRQDLVEAYKWYALASSYSSNDFKMHDEAILALGALQTRLSALQIAEAGKRADAWWSEKQAMYGNYYAGAGPVP